MTDSHDDRRLREALAEAHRSTRDRTPPFARLWARAAGEAARRPAGRRRRLAAAAAAVALAAAIGLWTAERRQETDLQAALAAATAFGQWRAPLDPLLDTPGRQWLETTPRLQAGPDSEVWRLPLDAPQEETR